VTRNGEQPDDGQPDPLELAQKLVHALRGLDPGNPNLGEHGFARSSMAAQLAVVAIAEDVRDIRVAVEQYVRRRSV
jgi:hypothetical protein